MPSNLLTAHDIMLVAGNAAITEVRNAANRLADEFDAGRHPGLTPADALRLLVASLPRREELDAHRDGCASHVERPDAG